jgi:hypothetical protein
VSIEHEGDHYVVDGRFDPRAVSGLGELSESEQGAFEGIADTMNVRVAITFPGEVIDHNGQLDGRTVTWTPSGTQAVEIHARAADSPPQNSSLAGPVIAALLILGAVAVLALGARRSQRRRADPPRSGVVET